MKDKRAELILHPIRMRIIQTLAANQRLTVQQIGEILSDVPQATLYRHLNKLVSADIMKVVDQNQIRGATEKVYALSQSGAIITPEEASKFTKEEHMNYFLQFVSNLIGHYGRYLEQEEIDLLKDGVGYRQIGLNLSDEEFLGFVSDLRSVVQKYLSNEAAPNRRLRYFSTIVMPEIQNKKG